MTGDSFKKQLCERIKNEARRIELASEIYFIHKKTKGSKLTYAYDDQRCYEVYPTIKLISKEGFVLMYLVSMRSEKSVEHFLI